MAQPDEIRAVIRGTRSLTQKPFGINLVLENNVHDRLNICLEEGVKIVSLFWGAPNSYIRASHHADAFVMHSVGSVSEAQEAAAAGADVIVAQGWEAGGHVCGAVSTLTLVPAVVDAVTPIPVVAAGGIADGRGIAAVFALGASAAWLGTRFVASKEAMAHHSYKQKLLAASLTWVGRMHLIASCEIAQSRCGRRPDVRPGVSAPTKAKSSREKPMVRRSSAIALVCHLRRCRETSKVWRIMPVKA